MRVDILFNEVLEADLAAFCKFCILLFDEEDNAAISLSAESMIEDCAEEEELVEALLEQLDEQDDDEHEEHVDEEDEWFLFRLWLLLLLVFFPDFCLIFLLF